MKNQSGAIKTNLELYRVVMGGSGGYRRLTGGSDDFSLQTHMHHDIYITIGVKNKSTLKQRHSRRKRTPAHCGSTTSMQAATSIHLTGQKLLPKLFCRLYVSVWKWQIVRWIDRLNDIKDWKWRTRGKYEDVMKMTITRMIKWIAVLTSTLTWSWSGLSFVLEPRGAWVVIRFLLSFYGRFWMFSTNAQPMRNFCIAKFFQSLAVCLQLIVHRHSIRVWQKICDHLFPQVRRPHPLAADDHLLDDGRHWNVRQYPRVPRHTQVIF